MWWFKREKSPPDLHPIAEAFGQLVQEGRVQKAERYELFGYVIIAFAVDDKVASGRWNDAHNKAAVNAAYTEWLLQKRVA